MEEYLKNLREQMGQLLSEFNIKAEEARENLAQFQEVFGKEFQVQSENFQAYRDQIESSVRDLLDNKELQNDLRSEIETALKDPKGSIDRLLDLLRKGKAN